MKDTRLIFVSLSFVVFTLMFSCNTDKLEPASVVPAIPSCLITDYDSQVKTIIDNSCAYSGCHLDAAPGNFSTYEGLKPFLTEDKFERFVIDLKDDAQQGMPPAYAPDGKPKDLTEEEIDIITCWIGNDYRESCEDVTYDQEIKVIIDRNCSYAGCHAGADYPPGDFTSYQGLQTFLTSELFERFVIDLKDDTQLGMPPAYAPDGNPQDLTADELELVTCWISSGYPEN